MRLFGQFPGEVPRIVLPRTPVIKGMKEGRGCFQTSTLSTYPCLLKCLRDGALPSAPVLLLDYAWRRRCSSLFTRLRCDR
jgi:hypothetical protein